MNYLINFRSMIILPVTILLLIITSCGSKKETAIEADSYYSCSMHPQVMEPGPGTCPICKMDLVEVKKNTVVSDGEIMLSDQQIQLGNIQWDTLRKTSMTDKIVLLATLNFDQTKLSSVSSRVMGRIERLYYKNVGDYVKKGSPLYDIYSEELNNAKQEYLLALEQKSVFADNSVIDFDRLIQSAKNKLLLWGLTENQINKLADKKKASPTTTFFSPSGGYITSLDLLEGDYVMEGGTIFNLADMSSLWAEAQVYTYEMGSIDKNSVASVQIPDWGDKEISGKITFVNPDVNPDTRINLLRVSIPNRTNELKPGMPAYVILKTPVRKGLMVPIDAVIRDGKAVMAWVVTGSNSFKNVMVETGLETDNSIEIKSGLNPGDILVTSGAYLLNSEYIFKQGADPMAGHDMSSM